MVTEPRRPGKPRASPSGVVMKDKVMKDKWIIFPALLGIALGMAIVGYVHSFRNHVWTDEIKPECLIAEE
jgi:hypothetical protein